MQHSKKDIMQTIQYCSIEVVYEQVLSSSAHTQILIQSQSPLDDLAQVTISWLLCDRPRHVEYAPT